MSINSNEFNAKIEKIRNTLRAHSHGGLLIRKQPNFSWLTGGRGFIGLASETACGSILVTGNNIYLITNTIEANRLRDEEVSGLPIELKVSPWESSDASIIKELTGSLSIVNDDQFSDQIKSMRLTLCSEEQSRYHTLSRETATVVEHTCKEELRPGMSEFQIAGIVSSGLWALGIEPITILVAVDERNFLYRHPLPTNRILHSYCMIVVCARRNGLITNATRLVHFGAPPAELVQKHHAAATVDAACILMSRPGVKISDIFTKLVETYQSQGFPGEWKFHHQGGATGYVAREYRAMPDSKEIVELGQAFAWNPTVAGTKSEDTILVMEHRNEVLTHTGAYPYIIIEFEGNRIERPAILVRI